VAAKAYHLDFICFSISKCNRGHETGRMSPDSRSGFTLIETLVAISIFHAREKMDEILLAQELTEGVIGGQFDDDFKWRAEARRLDIKEAKDARLPFRAFNIKVEVLWNAGGTEKHFAISAIKLVKLGQDNL
jgi:hypothetical protein